MPKKITSKDLTQISELLDAEDLCYRKCQAYEQMCQDTTLKKKLREYMSRHKTRFDALLSQLN